MEIKDVKLQCYYCDARYTNNHFYWKTTASDKQVTICPQCAGKNPLTNYNK